MGINRDEGLADLYDVDELMRRAAIGDVCLSLMHDTSKDLGTLGDVLRMLDRVEDGVAADQRLLPQHGLNVHSRLQRRARAQLALVERSRHERPQIGLAVGLVEEFLPIFCSYEAVIDARECAELDQGQRLGTNGPDLLLVLIAIVLVVAEGPTCQEILRITLRFRSSLDVEVTSTSSEIGDGFPESVHHDGQIDHELLDPVMRLHWPLATWLLRRSQQTVSIRRDEHGSVIASVRFPVLDQGGAARW